MAEKNFSRMEGLLPRVAQDLPASPHRPANFPAGLPGRQAGRPPLARELPAAAVPTKKPGGHPAASARVPAPARLPERRFAFPGASYFRVEYRHRDMSVSASLSGKGIGACAAHPSGRADRDMTQGEDVTQVLKRWQHGDPQALEALIPLVYSQLHRIAASYMRREGEDHTLQPTALINEVYLRLQRQRDIRWDRREHFYVFAALLMRNILTDHARARMAARRGGDGITFVPLSEESAWVGTMPENLLDLSRALQKLEQLDARKARIVELKYYLALSMEEAAEVLNISLATAERDLRFSRSWLLNELSR
jgi:RNA polymerase sigma factor (TIGR02999 family)